MAIFGENNLDDLGAAGRTYQCDHPDTAPAAGRMFYNIGGKDCFLGSGGLVGANDIVVTAAHLLFDNNGRFRASGTLFFRMYEQVDGECREADYPVVNHRVGAVIRKEDLTNGSKDWTVVKLERQVQDYFPLQLPNEAVTRAIREEMLTGGGGKLQVVFSVFNHEHDVDPEATQLALQNCVAYASSSNHTYVTDGTFTHDCDDRAWDIGWSFQY